MRVLEWKGPPPRRNPASTFACASCVWLRHVPLRAMPLGAAAQQEAQHKCREADHLRIARQQSSTVPGRRGEEGVGFWARNSVCVSRGGLRCLAHVMIPIGDPGIGFCGEGRTGGTRSPLDSDWWELQMKGWPRYCLAVAGEWRVSCYSQADRRAGNQMLVFPSSRYRGDITNAH